MASFDFEVLHYTVRHSRVSSRFFFVSQNNYFCRGCSDGCGWHNDNGGARRFILNLFLRQRNNGQGHTPKMPSSVCNPTSFFVFLLALFAALTLYVNQFQLEELPTLKHIQLQAFMEGKSGSAATAADDDDNVEALLGNFSLAGLSCERFGGPSDTASQEMVYWSDIPEDNRHVSPFYQPNQFLTFEPDSGGWNNIRM